MAAILAAVCERRIANFLHFNDKEGVLVIIVSPQRHYFAATKADTCGEFCYPLTWENLMAAVMDQLDGLEIGLCLRINHYGKRNGVRRFFSIISRLGDGGFWCAMGCLLIVMQGSAAYPAILRIALTTIAGVIIYKTLKRKLIRERPYIAHAGIELGEAPLDRYSFPSGHTMHAASLTVFFASAEPVLLLVALPFACLVAISRVVLGLHYPSDVVVGAALGIALATAAISYT